MDKKVGKDTDKKTQAGREVYETPEGEMVSEKSTTFKYKGKWINVPSIHNGYMYDEDTLILMLDQGLIKPTSTHSTLEDAVEAAQERTDTLEFNKGGISMNQQLELFDNGGLKDQGGTVDKVSGNDVPIGSTQKEVRDDIPAMLSEGEFVLPADVVRFHGLEKIMGLRDQAKMGLQKMEDMGQMGNSDEATLDDDVPFGMDDLIIDRNYNVGGFNPPSSQVPTYVAPPTGGYMPKFIQSTVPVAPPSTGGSDDSGDPFIPEVTDVYTKIKYINKATGDIREFSFYQGEPVTPIPDGYVPYDPEADLVDEPETVTPQPTVTRSDDDDGPNIPVATPFDYDNATGEEIVAEVKKLNGPASTVIAGVMGLLNPLGGLAAGAMMKANEKNTLTKINEKLKNDPDFKSKFSKEQLEELKVELTKLSEKSESGGIASNLLSGIIETVSNLGKDLGLKKEEIANGVGTAITTGAGTEAAIDKTIEKDKPALSPTIDWGNHMLILQEGKNTVGLIPTPEITDIDIYDFDVDDIEAQQSVTGIEAVDPFEPPQKDTAKGAYVTVGNVADAVVNRGGVNKETTDFITPLGSPSLQNNLSMEGPFSIDTNTLLDQVTRGNYDAYSQEIQKRMQQGQQPDQFKQQQLESLRQQGLNIPQIYSKMQEVDIGDSGMQETYKALTPEEQTIVAARDEETVMSQPVIQRQQDDDDPPTTAVGQTFKQGESPLEQKIDSQMYNRPVMDFTSSGPFASEPEEEEEETPKETYQQKIQRGGGFNEGGLVSRKKNKAKRKPNNKRGIAARN